jgi:hypothetical protein
MTEDNESQTDMMPSKKRGRIAGTKNRITAKSSLRTLAKLGFDPIVEMVKLNDSLDAEMFLTRYDVNGELKVKYSQMAYAQLLATKKALLTDLLRYSYARVSETVMIDDQRSTGLVVNLTKEGEPVVDASYEMSEFALDLNEDDEDDEPDHIDEQISAIAKLRLNVRS